MSKSDWGQRRVLVTGGASFIGSRLVDRLVDLGAQVRVADDLSSGRLENLHDSPDRIDFHQGDLRDRDFTRAVGDGEARNRLPFDRLLWRTGLHRHAPSRVRLEPRTRRDRI